MTPENQLLKPRLMLNPSSFKPREHSPFKKRFLKKPSLNSSLLKMAKLSRKNNVKIGQTNGLLTRKAELKKLPLLNKLNRSLLPNLIP